MSLADKDLLDITDYLTDMEKHDIYHLGLVLGLRRSTMEQMMDSNTFLDDIIAAWLQKGEEVTEKGEPSWPVLISALTHDRIRLTEIANKIASDRKCKLHSVIGLFESM